MPAHDNVHVCTHLQHHISTHRSDSLLYYTNIVRAFPVTGSRGHATATASHKPCNTSHRFRFRSPTRKRGVITVNSWSDRALGWVRSHYQGVDVLLHLVPLRILLHVKQSRR